MSAESVIATYRLQLHPGFTLDDAAGVVPYLARLGISHVYLSPFLQAAPGSTHGYDVVDPSRVNAELGGMEAYERLCATLERAGIGQILDVVPNHMAVAGDWNPWWWDVLENGPSSRFAGYFDVDWEASEERWPNKVLLPVLGNHYGRILEAGELQLRYADGLFTLHYHEHRFPLDPSSLGDLLHRASGQSGIELLGFLAESCTRLPRPQVTARRAVERRRRDQAVIRRLLDEACRSDAEARAAIDVEVERINADPDILDALIDRQNYRLAWWRTARQDLGYRRFFDINDLAGLRVEEDEVFQAVHALPIRWVQQGIAQGLRIDHPDGLRDPAQYFHRLREACSGAWIVAEKILEPGEALPAHWPIAGSTGYDFLNRVQGLFVDPRGEPPLTRLYEEVTGETADFPALVYESKRQVLRELLGSEIHRLTSLFVAVCERHRRHRDYTRDELQEALLEVAACFPVYRSYVVPGSEAAETDAACTGEAIEQARGRRETLDQELLDFLRRLLLLQIEGDLETELALRFQQLTGPAMAKGVEDTAFYRYHRLVALNEVGGDPARFGISVPDFHQACMQALDRHPEAMLATSTHDTKRSEDVRTRLLLLSEMPGHWASQVRDWFGRNARYRSGEWPDAGTEYLFYQTLVGAWPIETDRVSTYLEKTMREAKRHTRWTQPDADYEQAVQKFAAAVLADPEFRKELEAFVEPLIPAGRINGLAQTLLKLTTPGVPDFYQGTELWDLSLVDPDNRRPVDFGQRSRRLSEIDTLSPAEILAHADEGLPKLWVIRGGLALRRRYPEWFGPEGRYQPLDATGERAAHAVAFLRGAGAVVLVPRLLLGLGGDWGDTRLTLPPGRWHNRLSHQTIDGGNRSVAEILGGFPVGLLEREEAAR
ncbi:Malto-oligosyltrehalose synthase [Thioalkalivibrio nitratireducens DSM 14787]|uniref:Malto-oligosyltrehalose synthase n=1 Tax=Thioalkalivibrio nitratireducens (strain DSM 14787 / UNIQEM 213 / ALEN2) TaxID=1255043 RepID=L0DUU6_THIND|nr:malto-oligosyltrehalose synthase [Thioalkalivibrio nitratireducens]AGA32793.1 Malto-oligosyltrehalose synthase [Thioalkalivibrio nitratireducens DSM 14787]